MVGFNLPFALPSFFCGYDRSKALWKILERETWTSVTKRHDMTMLWSVPSIFLSFPHIFVQKLIYVFSDDRGWIAIAGQAPHSWRLDLSGVSDDLHASTSYVDKSNSKEISNMYLFIWKYVYYYVLHIYVSWMSTVSISVSAPLKAHTIYCGFECRLALTTFLGVTVKCITVLSNAAK